MQRILFIYSLETAGYPKALIREPLSSPEMISMGISYISALLKKNNHQTDLLVLSSSFGLSSLPIIQEKINTFSPHIICFTAVSSQYHFISDIAGYIKKEFPGIPLIIGGAHISLNPDNAIQDVFDVICIGEGEYPLLEYVNSLDKGETPNTIPNLIIKTGAKIDRNPTRQFIEALDSLPFPDREMWMPFITQNANWRFSVLLGRGCPFKCTYCSNNKLKALAKGSYVRWRSPENIIKEITELHQKFPANKEFYLEVETIDVNQKWAISLFESLKKINDTLSEPLSFGVNLRLRKKPRLEHLFSVFQAANVRFINIGLESGSERVRRDILKRDYSNQTVIKTVELARKYGLQVAFYNLVGIPGETPADFRETVRINRICQPDWHFTSIFYPYPGTELYDVCIQSGLVPENSNPALERKVACLDLPEFKKNQIQKYYIWLDFFVYFGKRPIYKIFVHVLGNYLQTKPRLRKSALIIKGFLLKLFSIFA